MNHFAPVRAKTESMSSTSYVVPSVLAVNTAALFALEALGGIPHWIKTAAALFLAF